MYGSVISDAFMSVFVTLIDNLKEGSLGDKTQQDHLQEKHN